MESCSMGLQVPHLPKHRVCALRHRRAILRYQRNMALHAPGEAAQSVLNVRYMSNKMTDRMA